MKYKKIIVKIICAPIIILFLISMTGFTLEPKITKNETVYIILDHDGSTKDQRVVNRVSGTSGEPNWIDFGKYDGIQNMVSEYVPEINGDEISWPMTVLEMGDLYYQGITDKDPPIGVDIKYYLDGEEIKGQELAGRSGDLKIKIKIENKLVQEDPILYLSHNRTWIKNDDEYYVPMMVQVQIKADLDIYSDIKADDGTKVIIGNEMSIGFGGYPFPEDEYIIEMKGKDIELAPISIMAIPQKLPFPETEDAQEGLTEMADGLDEMIDGTYELVDGMDEMLDRSGEFEDGIQDLIEAIAEINHGAYQLDINSAPISSGMKDLVDALDILESETGALAGGLDEINQNTGSIGTGLNQMAAGAAELSKNINLLSGGMMAFQTGHGSLITLANLVLADPEASANDIALANGVIAEGPPIDEFANGLQGASAGAAGLSSGLSSLSGNFSAFSSAIGDIASGAGAMTAGAGELAGGMRGLYDGWEDYCSGISELYGGTQTFYDETTGLNSEVDELLSGIEEVRDGIKKLVDEGMIEIEEGVIKNIDDIKYGEAMKEEVDRLAEDYDSFIDNEKNQNSEVQFVMQTEEIKVRGEVVVSGLQEPQEDKTIFQKLVSWFTD